MISGRFLPESYGGSENQCILLCSALIEQGFDVTVLTSRSKFLTPPSDNLNGIKIVRLLTFGPPQYFSIRFMYASVIWAIKLYLWLRKRHYKYDVIHSHQSKFQAFAAVWLARIFSKKAIIKIANGGKEFELELLRKKPLGNKMFDYILKNVDFIVAISSEIKSNLQETGINQNKIVHIPNGVEIADRFVDYQIYRNEIKFIFTGRFETQKNILNLITAFKKINLEFPDTSLALLGDGSQKPIIEDLIDENNLVNNVFLPGFVKDVKKWLLDSDFFVLPSLVEGMSNSLLEAMSVGLIPICTKVSGTSDLIEDGLDGFLIESKNENSIYETFKRVLSLDNQMKVMLGENALSKIRNHHDIHKISKRYIDLYKD
ncbi:MAG: glycosyltransferase family 4 protein [Bacteroidota bacterium]